MIIQDRGSNVWKERGWNFLFLCVCGGEREKRERERWAERERERERERDGCVFCLWEGMDLVVDSILKKRRKNI